MFYLYKTAQQRLQADSGSLARDYSLFSLLSPPPYTVTVAIILVSINSGFRAALPNHLTLLHISSILLENVITGYPLAGCDAKPVNSG
jgi:hypothetical protein